MFCILGRNKNESASFGEMCRLVLSLVSVLFVIVVKLNINGFETTLDNILEDI